MGDKVLAKDENNPDGELAYKEVTALYRNQRDDIIKLHVGEQIIETTDNHPFYIEGKGWVFADELQAGDKLQKADGSNLTIDKVEFVKLDEPVTVYNFTVADFHTYYVTDIGIWVHNTTCATKSNYRKLYTDVNPGMPSNYQVHHTLPQKYESIMSKTGINIHETQYLRGVDPKIHSKITTEWTKWDKSLSRSPTAQEVQNFANQIDLKYGQYWYK